MSVSLLLTPTRLAAPEDALRFAIVAEHPDCGEQPTPRALLIFGAVDLVITQRTGRVASVRWRDGASAPQPARLPVIRARRGHLVVDPGGADIADMLLADSESTATYRDEHSRQMMIVRRDLERASVDRYVEFAERTTAGLRGGTLVALWRRDDRPVAPLSIRPVRAPSPSPSRFIAGSSPPSR